MSAWFAVDWGQGGVLLRDTFHFTSSTLSSNGGISAGLAGSSLLNMSLNSLHSERSLFFWSSSPAMCISESGSVSENSLIHSKRSHSMNHQFHLHQAAQLQTVIPTPELIKLRWHVFGWLSDVPFGLMEDLLGFPQRFAKSLQADSYMSRPHLQKSRLHLLGSVEMKCWILFDLGKSRIDLNLVLFFFSLLDRFLFVLKHKP